MILDYDIVVVGGGHAGLEAATAAATMGSRTLLVTMDMNKLGQMSCNPAIGGIAKGQIVREIDALGGHQGIVTDRSAIQFRMLNKSKGAAMWSPRSQADRKRYIEEWTKVCTETPNLFIWQDTATEILVENGKIRGIKTQLGVHINARAVILTNGTFLNGLMHFGQKKVGGGRISEPASFGLTEQLCSLGFKTDRMKTGTPCRIDKRSIDFNKMAEQKGDDDWHKFSYLPQVKRELKQMSCYITYTNEKTHNILRQHLDESPMYNGQIHSIGPRYCPSIETKIVTFADKPAHQLFIEPEGVDSNEYYLNGFSSSMPMEVQFEAIHTIEGLENAVFYRPGYAIEYDFFDPTQLLHTLETKIIENLFFAGQINGTTGYEEAAGQGLVAGINAHRKINNLSSFVLKRDEAYIGVLIDDLVNKGVDEPYRMFTSRAEYRILLRQDNADSRLTEMGYNIGLADKERYSHFTKKQTLIKEFIEYLNSTKIKPEEINSVLEAAGTNRTEHSLSAANILLRPQITIDNLLEQLPELKQKADLLGDIREEVLEEAEIQIKYAGYIEREKLAADKLRRLDSIKIPASLDFNTLQSLTTEARQKLQKIRPQTIGQASHIPGVSPNDISVLLVYLGR
ncbi:MAG: tRNA uridine-5-carboxymethylaminomethyl(34) synthesis enzyme MnmG [Paludibacteraceae bacterium]|nr:tRNA uridine-5-carboxymethylaminomethyl(34) synthesis enzyme MnmG [Paludibacteraceae bacterium]